MFVCAKLIIDYLFSIRLILKGRMAGLTFDE